MSRSPSPNTSPSPRSSAADLLKNPPATSSENVNPAKNASRPSISFAGTGAGPSGAQDGRRPSIQFAPTLAKAASRSGSRPATPVPRKSTRLSSPPPPSTYESRVAFDTFDNPEATDPSFTLMYRHRNYAYTRHQRVFLCGTDQNDYSEFALEWLMEELVEDGDEVICLRVVDKDSELASDAAVIEQTYKVEARRMLDHIREKNNKRDGRAINLILEFAVGRVEETIQRMISIYSPACLIVGTRGRSLGGIQGLLPGSVSKWCLQNSPVPVVVVRPKEKRAKKMKKRLTDPNRQGYSTILDQSTSHGAAALETLAEKKVMEASAHEAEAVAKAIGIQGPFGSWKGFKKDGSDSADADGAPLTKVSSVRSQASQVESEPESPSPTGAMFVDGPDFKVPREVPRDEEEEEEEEEEEGEKAGKEHGEREKEGQDDDRKKLSLKELTLAGEEGEAEAAVGNKAKEDINSGVASVS